MTKDRVKITSEPINYGQFINQFSPDIIKSIRQLDMDEYIFYDLFMNTAKIYTFLYS